MSSEGSTVFQNPQWEAARKALEAVSPQKQKKDTNDTEQTKSNQSQGNNASRDSAMNGNDISPQELYYQHFQQFKQRQGMLPNRPPYV